MAQALAVSRSMTDVLLQKHDAGSLLKIYHLTQYPCSADGALLVDENRDCLKNNGIGSRAMNLGHIVETSFAEKSKEFYNVQHGQKWVSEIWCLYKPQGASLKNSVFFQLLYNIEFLIPQLKMLTEF